MSNIKEDEGLEEAIPFDVAFQEKFREAMLSMIRTPRYREALDCFRAAYIHRKSFPWLPESNETRDELNQDGLSYALRGALSTYIVPDVAASKGEDGFMKPGDVYGEDEKRCEAGWASALVSAVDATIREGFGLKRFENQLYAAGIDVADLSTATLQRYVAAALMRYYNRRNIGVARDPL